MKKIVLFTLSILFINTLNAQFFTKKIKGNGHYTQISRQVNTYDAIAIAGDFFVELVKGHEGKIDIEIEDNLVEYLEIESVNNKLTIKWKENTSIHSEKKVNIKIPVEDLEQVTLAGSGEVNNKEMLKFDNLTLKLAGSGNISLHLATNNLILKLAGSGTVSLKGKSNDASYLLAGSGMINAFDFTTNSLEAKVAGSGDMEVWVTDLLKATVAGNGDILYKGHPKKDEIKVAGSGKIKMIP